MSLDLTKELKIAPIDDINKRYASTENILKTFTTSLPSNKTNTYTFQDTAQVSHPLIISKTDINDNDKSVLDNLSDSNKFTFTKVLGYEPKNIEDINLSIDKITELLKNKLANHSDWNYFDYNSYLDKNINFINKEKFPSIYFNNNDDKKYLDYLNNKRTSLRYNLENVEVNESLFKPDYNFLDNISENDENKTFISDEVSADYLPSNEDANTLIEFKNFINNTLKYATTLCNDLVDLLNTMITSMGNMMKSLVELMKSALANNANSFLADLLRCFDKLKDVLFRTYNAKQIGNQITKEGSLDSLKVLLDQGHDDKYNNRKLLYNTTKNANTINKEKFNQIKSQFNILTDDFIAYPKLPDLNQKTILSSDNEIYDLAKIKSNKILSKTILDDNPDSSLDSNFLLSVPLNWA